MVQSQWFLKLLSNQGWGAIYAAQAWFVRIQEPLTRHATLCGKG